MIEIKPLAAEHVAQIAQLEKVCFSDPWSENAISSELNNRLSFWLIATCGEMVMGYVGSQVVLGEADMMNLAVAPEHRRAGLGEQLVKELIEELKCRDCHSLTLEVRISNEAAISLYNKLGFTQVGKRPNYYFHPKEDALILRKEWNS